MKLAHRERDRIFKYHLLCKSLREKLSVFAKDMLEVARNTFQHLYFDGSL